MAGFSLVFMVLGIVLSATFGLAGNLSTIINIVAGLIVILLGINIIFDFWKVLSIEKRFRLKQKPSGGIGSLLFGMAFGAGWSPCVGPILGSILLLAGTTGKLWQALALLFVYSAGLGLPFLLTGFFFSAAIEQFEKIKPHLNKIRIVSGMFLVFIGLLILLGRLQRINIFLFSMSAGLQNWESADPLGARLVFGLAFLVFCLVVGIFYARRVHKDMQAVWLAEGPTERQVERLVDRQVEQPVGNLEDGPVERSDENETAASPVEPKGERHSGVSRAKLWVFLRPVRLFFLLFFLLAGILTLSGLADVTSLIFFWLNFQGI
ncbi:hypothetical protein ES703_55301 [subsurface metagenome]